jgi:hypothetical protein
MERLESQILAKHNIKRGAAGATAEDAAAHGNNGTSNVPGGKTPAPAKAAEVAPDGKPVVRIPVPAREGAKNGGAGPAEDPKRAATKPAN